MSKIKGAAYACFALTLVFALALQLTGCSVKVRAADLMEGVRARAVEGRETDEAFAAAYANFALLLFQETATKEKSSLVSPLSVMLALAMTANGADANTKAEMESLLGGGINLENLNEYLYSYVNALPSDKKYKVKTANSIWFRDAGDPWVNSDFLQKNADYYAASAYASPFDAQTVKDINGWVKAKTDGMIDAVVDKIEGDSVMYLINTLVFNAEWAHIYEKKEVSDGIFTTCDGVERAAQMMFSIESSFIETGDATGFIKPYKNGAYAFVALLPKSGVPLEDCIRSFTGENFLAAINSAETAAVETKIPKFSYDYTIEMKDALVKLGIPAAFDPALADFSRLGAYPGGNIYIGGVLHKTFISVAERGTKAGAVTVVDMKAGSAAPEQNYTVFLDRPFLYAIIDTATSLPLFMGTMTDIR